MIVLGIMSGTSLDGLDLAICSFEEKGKVWRYHILHTETVPYDGEWYRKLSGAPMLTGLDLHLLDHDYGRYIADNARSVISTSGIDVGLISTHGHTVFHRPEASFTLQIGRPQVVASSTGIRTVGDFRQQDMLNGGQGAPLVPVGDELLFSEYDYCLNLGGFANISYNMEGRRLARDICPVNIILNRFSSDLGLPFDDRGRASRSGNLNKSLLQGLNAVPYYAGEGPGSLAREWVESDLLPVINEYSLPVTDILRTVTEHIAIQVSRHVSPRSMVLATGGGAYNTFLLERIIHHSKSEVVAPPAELLEFKEAMVFAFMGLLRQYDRINCYSSVTGAAKDSSCGVIFNP